MTLIATFPAITGQPKAGSHGSHCADVGINLPDPSFLFMYAQKCITMYYQYNRQHSPPTNRLVAGLSRAKTFRLVLRRNVLQCIVYK